MAKYLSIEIDDRSIKIIEGAKRGSDANIYNYITVDTPSDSVSDGRLIQPDAVVDTIRKCIAQHKIKTKKTILSINTSAIITRNIELPFLKTKKEILSMLKNELENLLPVDLNDYNLIYKVTSTYTLEDVKYASYMVFGLPINIYDQYMQMAEQLKLVVISIDNSFNSLDAIAKNKIKINGKPIEENSVEAFIEIKYNVIYFTTVTKGINDFSRNIGQGTGDIVSMLSGAFDTDEQQGIEELKLIDLTETYESSNSKDITRNNLCRESIDGWITEINRYIRYYNSKNKEQQINSIYIYGQFARTKGLDVYFTSQLNINCMTVDKVDNFTANQIDDETAFEVREYFNAVLALYVNLKEPNFLTEKQKKHQVKFNSGVAAMAVSVTLVLVGLFFGYNSYTKYIKYKNEIAVMDKFISAEQNILSVAESNERARAIGELERYRSLVLQVRDGIISEDIVVTAMFHDVAKAVPTGTSINSVAISSEGIQLQCTSSTKNEAAQFERNLKEIKYIDHVFIPAIGVGGDKVAGYTYSVACNIVKGGVTDEAQ